MISNQKTLFFWVPIFKDICILELHGACAFDDSKNGILKGHHEENNHMTISLCLSICRRKKFKYSGLRKRSQCHCGDEPIDGFQWAWQDKCRMKCRGSATEICGGWDAISIWTTPHQYLDGLCVYDFPKQRRVLDEYHISHINLSTDRCREICSGRIK